MGKQIGTMFGGVLGNIAGSAYDKQKGFSTQPDPNAPPAVGGMGAGFTSENDPYAYGVEGAEHASGATVNSARLNELELRRQLLEGKRLAPQQQAFADQLANQALGKGPSVTELQLRSAMDRSLGQQVAASKANRAVNPALAARQNAKMAQQSNLQTAQMAGVQKLQEQQQAQNQFANYLGQQQQARQSGLQLGLGGGSQLSAESNAVRNRDLQEQQMQNQMIGSVLGAGASVAGMMSDERMKKDIQPSKNNSKKFLDALSSKEYKYKNDKNGSGKHVSVMAQDLEKAGPMGKQMVSETKQGKMVDYGKGFGAILAAQVELNERMKEMEARYKKPSKG